MFTVAERDRVRDHVLRLAGSDSRVVAGAVVGSLAHGEGDRWSDLDLTFAVQDSVAVVDVLEEWSNDLRARLHAVDLFDVPSGGFVYRVFLLPGCLQLDLSLAPAAQFGARGPRFRLLFGEAAKSQPASVTSAREMFGHAVHHAVRARFCIERGRAWQAEYWISGVRDLAMSLACRRRDLPAAYGRGVDELPTDLLDRFQDALVRSLDPAELRRALGAAVQRLMDEVEDVSGLASMLAPQLRELLSED